MNPRVWTEDEINALPPAEQECVRKAIAKRARKAERHNERRRCAVDEPVSGTLACDDQSVPAANA
jgi:hypothetical protein